MLGMAKCAAWLALGCLTCHGPAYGDWPKTGIVELAQSRPTESKLRDVIERVRQGQPNYEEMEPPLALAVQQQLVVAQARLRQLGSVVSLRFEGQHQGADIYGVTFERGISVWGIGLSATGTISILWYQ